MTEYYKTTITIEVISDRTLAGLELQQILNETEWGDAIMASFEDKEEILNKEEMEKAVIAAGSDPSFFTDEDEEERRVETIHPMVFCWMLNCQNAPLPNKLGCEQHPSYEDKNE